MNKIEFHFLAYINDLKSKVKTYQDILKYSWKIKKVIQIYYLAKQKDKQNLINFINNLKISQKKTFLRDWEFDDNQENIEIFFSIEMISLTFLNSLKEKLWTKQSQL